MHLELGHPIMATLALELWFLFCSWLLAPPLLPFVYFIPLPLLPPLAWFSQCLYEVCTFFRSPTTTAEAQAPSQHLEITLSSFSAHISLPTVIIRPVLNTYLSRCEPCKDKSSVLSIISQCHHPSHTHKHIYSHTLTHPHSPTHTHSSAYPQTHRLQVHAFTHRHCMALHLVQETLNMGLVESNFIFISFIFDA